MQGLLNWFDYHDFLRAEMDQLIGASRFDIHVPQQLGLLHELEVGLTMINAPMIITLKSDLYRDRHWLGQGVMLGCKFSEESNPDTITLNQDLFVQKDLTGSQIEANLVDYTLPSYLIPLLDNQSTQTKQLLKALGVDHYSDNLVKCMEPLFLKHEFKTPQLSYALHQRSLMNERFVKLSCQYMLDQIRADQKYHLDQKHKVILERIAKRVTTKALKVVDF